MVLWTGIGHFRDAPQKRVLRQGMLHQGIVWSETSANGPSSFILHFVCWWKQLLKLVFTCTQLFMNFKQRYSLTRSRGPRWVALYTTIPMASLRAQARSLGLFVCFYHTLYWWENLFIWWGKVNWFLCGDAKQQNLTKVGFCRIFHLILPSSLFNERHATSMDNNQPPLFPVYKREVKAKGDAF